MKLWILAVAFLLATPAPASNCGWTGLVLAPPEVEVRGPDVRLERPLQVVDVEDDSPAERAGMDRGMEILSLDREHWDESGFLPNLVRLQTVGPGETLRVVARDGDAEASFRIEAEPCSPAQAERRAFTLANLGQMEAALRARDREARVRDERRYAGAREMYESAVSHHESARRELEGRLMDPEVQERIVETLVAAQAQLAAARNTMQSQEWYREMDLSMRQMRAAMENQETRHLVEESLRQVRDSESEMRLALEAARGGLLDEASREEIARALLEVQARIHDAQSQAEMEESLRRARESMPDQETARRMDLAIVEARESQLAARRLLEELQVALPDEKARLQLKHALEQAQHAMQGEEWHRQLEQSLRLAEERLESTRSREMEMELVAAQMRRALDDAGKGRESRRRALLEASEAARFIRDVGVVFRGAMFQRVEPGIARHVDVDHGVLVMNLEPGCVLAEAGVEVGDIIVAIDGRQVEGVQELFEQAAERVEELDRGGDADFLELELHTPDGRRAIEVPLGPGRSRVVGPI